MVYTSIFLFLLSLFYSLANPKFAYRYFGYFAWALAGGTILTLFIWLPALFYATSTNRIQLSLGEALVGSLGWNEIWRVFLGGLSQPEISRCDPWESTCYLGITALLFIPIGWKAVPGRLRYGLTAAFLFAMFCTLGEQGGLFVWLYQLVPGWSFLNLPNRSLSMAAIVLPIFIGFGVNQVLNSAKPSLLKMGLIGIAVCIGTTIVVTVFWSTPWAWRSLIYSAMTTTFQPDSIPPVQWSGLNFVFWMSLTLFVLLPLYLRNGKTILVIVLLAVLTMAQSMQYTQRLFLQTTAPNYFDVPNIVQFLHERLNETPGRVCGYTPYLDNPGDVRIANLQSALVHRLPDVFRIPEIQGYDPIYPKHYAELIRAWAGQEPAVDPVRKLRIANLPPRMLDFLGIRYVVGFPTQSNLFRGPFEVNGPDSVRSPFPEPITISSFSIRWLAAGGFLVNQGQDMGSIHLVSNEQTVESFPIRMGTEIANYIMQQEGQNARHREANLYRWFPIPSINGYTQIQQYRTDFAVASENEIDAIEFEWLSPQSTLVLQQIDYQTREQSDLQLISNEQELPLYENPDPFGPVYVSRHVKRYNQVEEIVQAFNQWEPDQDIPVFLAQDEQQVFDTSPIAGTRDEHSSVTVQRPHSDEIHITVKSQYDSMLVIHENYSPNWQAKINREPVALIRANHAFMALPVSAGEHQVTLTYVPRFYYLVSSISGATLIVFFILIFMHTGTFIRHWDGYNISNQSITG